MMSRSKLMMSCGNVCALSRKRIFPRHCLPVTFKWMSTMFDNLPRTKLKLDVEVEESLTESNVKKHPGIATVKTVNVPPLWADAVKLSFKNDNPLSFKLQAQELTDYLWHRRAPPEEEFLKKRAKDLEQLCLEQNKINRKKYKTLEEVERAVNKWVKNKIVATTYNWQSINYVEGKCYSYLLGRSPAEYATLIQIFYEIKKRIPSFCPRTILDFGSGTGTVLWAAYDTWGKAIEEYFAVDISADMNNISRLIAQGGNPDSAPIVKGVFYRQFLPATHTRRYEVVTSSHCLMELPSMKTRLQTLENLWFKTQDFLVLVESGTNAGYELLAEARDFILKISEDDVHVFSPCTHELTCPRLADKTPCNFEVRYFPMFQNDNVKTEVYSYLVLRKQKRNDEGWPRIVRPVLPRSRHVICRLCCQDGQLKEAVITPTKNGKLLYRCAKRSNWGDRLPTTSNDV